MLTELAGIFLALALQAPAAPIAVSVDPGANRHAISPLIYGVSFADFSQPGAPPYPLDRWGGNAVTRYSWQNDVANHASDWFFENIASGPDPGTLPDGSAADQLIDAARASGSDPLITVPLIGWTPKDRTPRWGFSVGKYGAQQSTDPYQPDAGNGHYGNGSPITGNDPTDTSAAIGPDFVTQWMAHIAGRVGGAVFTDVPVGRVRRGVDRGPRGPRDHGRLRGRQLLPGRGRHAEADGRVPAEGGARIGLRASGGDGALRRRPTVGLVRAMDRTFV